MKFDLHTILFGANIFDYGATRRKMLVRFENGPFFDKSRRIFDGYSREPIAIAPNTNLSFRFNSVLNIWSRSVSNCTKLKSNK